MYVHTLLVDRMLFVTQAHIDPWPCTDDPVHENSELTVTLLGERNSDVEDIIEREFSVYFTAKVCVLPQVRELYR